MCRLKTVPPPALLLVHSLCRQANKMNRVRPHVGHNQLKLGCGVTSDLTSPILRIHSLF